MKTQFFLIKQIDWFKGAAGKMGFSRSNPLRILFSLFFLHFSALLYAQEIRALWVVRQTLENPDLIDQMVESAAQNGFNTLIVQVRGRGDAYYRSDYEPRADALAKQAEDFDPLARVIERAREKNLKVHAWINTYLVANFGLPQSLNHLIYQHPEWIMVPRKLANELYDTDANPARFIRRIIQHSKGSLPKLEGLYIEPAHPEVQEHILNIWLNILSRYEIDGLHFDYVRYPNPDLGFSRVALDLFRQEVDRDLDRPLRALLSRLYMSDRLVYTRLYPDQWNAFRRQRVTDLVERIYAAVKSQRPEVMVTAAVFPDPGDAYTRRSQDWRSWLKMGILDGICPMAYDPDSQVFRNHIALARVFSFGRQVWAGIGAFRSSLASTVEKIKIAQELQTEGFVLFSYTSLTTPGKANPGGQNLARISRLLEQ